VSGGSVGTEGMVMNSAADRHPETNSQRPQIAFAVTSIALSLEIHGTQFWEVPAHSLVTRVLVRAWNRSKTWYKFYFQVLNLYR